MYEKIKAFKELWEKQVIYLPDDEQKDFRKMIDGFVKELEDHKREFDTINHRSFWTRVAIDELIKKHLIAGLTHIMCLSRGSKCKKRIRRRGVDP